MGGNVPQVDGDFDLPDSENENDSEINTESDNSCDNDTINRPSDEYSARILLTNARSLLPKIDSLTDAFGSLDLHLACITETWYRGGKELKEHLIDVEGSKGIRILQKSRDGRIKKRGGGVAIAFNTATCNFKQRHLSQACKNHEILCAVGKIGKIDKKVVVFTIYIPPNTRAVDARSLGEALASEVTAVKVAYRDPLVVIAGDFNHRDIVGSVDLAESIDLVRTGPTRGDNVIDMIYTNFANKITERLTLPPLQDRNGNYSDHRCVFVAATIQAERNFTWEVKMRRLRDERRERAFANDLEGWDWSTIEGAQGVDDKCEEFQSVVQQLTETHFPLVRVRKRSNESPWITRTIRRLWKKKIRIYKKEGRSQAWWDVDSAVQEKIESSRVNFVDKMLEEGNRGSSFYTATKKLAKAAVVRQWTVKDLFVGRPASEVGREVLGYFGKIATGGGKPPGGRRCPGGLPLFTAERTTELLRAVKKSDSYVDGDPLPNLVRTFPSAFARPIAAICNGINETGTWPSSWKTEHLTIIPKNPNPADLSECRNISCTSLFSKVMEGQVLQQLRTELQPDAGQYGGTPKCGVEHMMVDLWEKVLTVLEGGQKAAILLGVDYEKAFNRMDHGVCLTQLERLGASEGSLSLVRAFLEERQMTIKIDGHKADPVKISKGSPQGSVLGCLLYCVTTQLLTVGLRADDDPNGEGLRYFPQDSSDEEDVMFWRPVGTPPSGPETFLYVDDTTLVDEAPMNGTIKHISSERTREVFEHLEVGKDFDTLSRRAEDIGMKINAKKTQLLVISPPNGCITSAKISTRTGETITSVESLKLLGFTFGTAPNVSAHVEAIEDQYKKKKWMLYHLRGAGFKGRHLYRLYCCFVRSFIEYCSAAYHAMLTGGQAEQLEKIQRHALRVCFGHDRDIEETMRAQAIETLGARRTRRCDTFITKAWNNPRFQMKWFPRREEVPWRLRNRRRVEEIHANSARRHNSPLAFMRRRANELGLWTADQE